MAESVNTAMRQIALFFGQTVDDVRLSEEDARQLRQTIDRLRSSIANLRLESDATADDRAA